MAGKLVKFPQKRTIFTQGDSGDSVFYLEDGIVKLSLTNETGKEAVIALLATGDSSGRGASATVLQYAWRRPTMAPTTVVKVEKDEMIRVLHEEKEFADASYVTCSSVTQN